MKSSITLFTLFVLSTRETEARIGIKNRTRRNQLLNFHLRPEASGSIELHHLGDTIWSKVLQNARRSNASCKSPTIDFIRTLARGMGKEKFTVLADSDIGMIPLYHSLLRDQSPLEYFGDNGEETREVKAAHEDCVDFWGRANLKTDNISLLGMHGSFMKDTDRLVPTLKAMPFHLFDTGYNTYLELARDIQEFIESIPFQYDNPLLTFNAVAYSNNGKNERIIVGDGILAYLHHNNVGEEGPEYVLAHEFGHQIQYESGLIMMGHDTDEEETAEESRYTELMADALAGYFLAHDEGGRMDGESIAEVYEAFNSGDCSTEKEGHHGTPAQRECALIWGANLGASNGNAVLHPSEFATLWERDIAKIVSLDAETCRKPGASLTLPPINLDTISAERPLGR